MSREKATLLQWLGLRREIDFSTHTSLGGFLGACLFFAALLLLLIGLVSLGTLLVALLGYGEYANSANAEGIRNLGLLLAATFGLPFLVWRSIVAQKQVDVAEQGHITDRINKAVQGLGTEKIVKEYNKVVRYKKANGWTVFDDDGRPIPVLTPDGDYVTDVENVEVTVANLEVRLGSIYALERIALDSPRDHIQIMEIFCAYVKGNTTKKLSTIDPRDLKVRIDVQAVLTVVGRRTSKQIGIEWDSKFRLDFSDANLDGADFSGGDFSGAKFNSTSLAGANFASARLLGTQFRRAFLNYADFWGAELIGTDFSDACYNAPERSYLGFSNSYGICLAGADVTALYGFGLRETGSSYGDSNTKLSPALDEERQRVYEIMEQFYSENDFEEWDKVQDLEGVRDSEFKYWSSRMAPGYLENLPALGFHRRFNLTGFPYTDV